MYPCGSGLCILCADALLDVTLDFSFTGFARLFLNEGFVNLPILGGNVIKKKNDKMHCYSHRLYNCNVSCFMHEVTECISAPFVISLSHHLNCPFLFSFLIFLSIVIFIF